MAMCKATLLINVVVLDILNHLQYLQRLFGKRLGAIFNGFSK